MMATAAGTLGTDAAIDLDLTSGSDFLGGGAFVWPYLHFAPWLQPEGTWWKMHGVLAFSAGVKGFPAPFDFPFGGEFAPAFFAAAFGGAGVSTAAATAGGVAGAAFAGTAGVPAFVDTDFFGLLSDSSMDLAFTSSSSSVKNSCKRSKHTQNLSYWDFLGISWFHQWPSQAYERCEAYGTKTRQASSYWANPQTGWHGAFSWSGLKTLEGSWPYNLTIQSEKHSGKSRGLPCDDPDQNDGKSCAGWLYHAAQWHHECNPQCNPGPGPATQAVASNLWSTQQPTIYLILGMVLKILEQPLHNRFERIGPTIWWELPLQKYQGARTTKWSSLSMPANPKHWRRWHLALHVGAHGNQPCHAPTWELDQQPAPLYPHQHRYHPPNQGPLGLDQCDQILATAQAV